MPTKVFGVSLMTIVLIVVALYVGKHFGPMLPRIPIIGV
jgi:hypothetical protein